ncbi:MAG: ELWxxDGT repeat protein [Polaribacter sp.]|uniref:ELWxxDGT repeat protein n=1 Tax=Polaribacter sp. TaxID=1920175 RepID=UPI003BB11E76
MRKQLLYICITLITIFNINAQIAIIKDINFGNGDANPNQLFSFNGKLYFTATYQLARSALYTTDGTETGTEVVYDFVDGDYSGFSQPIIFNNDMYFRAVAKAGGQLIKTDGTNFSVVKQIFPVFGADVNGFIVFDNSLFFSATESFSARQRLYKTDGTEAGTVKVKDVQAGAEKIEYNNMLYFSGENSENGNELWKSDGTEAGTVLVKDINSGASDSNPEKFIILNDMLLFIAKTAENGSELWKTDGTEEGTILIKDIRSGTSNSSPKEFTIYKNRVYFQANSGTGNKLWVSDGTESGTNLFKDLELNNTTFSSIVFKDKLFFAAKDGDFGYELWCSDGTPENTTMLKDISPGDRNDHGNPNDFFIFNNELFFEAYTDELGKELYKRDGTEAGTVLIADLHAGNLNADPQRFADHNSILFFSADGGETGRELFKYETATATATSNSLKDVLIYTTDYTINIKGLVTQKSTLKIYDILGKEQMKINFTSNGNAKIGINLKSGIYIVNIKTENGSTISKKVIIK